MAYVFQKWFYLLSTQKINFDTHQVTIGDCLLINFREKTHIYIITQGCIRLSKIFMNKETLTLGILVQGDLINMIEIIDNETNYYYSAEALSQTLIISCNYKKLLEQPSQNISIYYELLLAYQNYIKKSFGIIEILSHRDKRDRLIHLLLLLCKQLGIITKFGIIINITITHNTLADIIGSNRITITKLLKSLRKSKLVSMYYQKIIVHDPILLSTYSNNQT